MLGLVLEKAEMGGLEWVMDVEMSKVCTHCGRTIKDGLAKWVLTESSWVVMMMVIIAMMPMTIVMATMPVIMVMMTATMPMTMTMKPMIMVMVMAMMVPVVMVMMRGNGCGPEEGEVRGHVHQSSLDGQSAGRLGLLIQSECSFRWPECV